MKFINTNKPHRKSGGVGHPSVVAGTELCWSVRPSNQIDYPSSKCPLRLLRRHGIYLELVAGQDREL